MQEHIQRTNRKSQRGMTLVEIIAALAVVGAVIVGALALFDNASSSQRATQLYMDVQALRTAAQQLYMGRGSYAGLAHGDLIAAQKVPPTLTITGGNITSVFNGAVTMGPTGTQQFWIQTANIPEAACEQLLHATNATWGQVQVGGTVMNVFPIPIATVNAACVAGNVNNITWTTRN